MQNNFDLKKFLVENKLTPSAQKNEGFMDMFSKSEPSETFQGDTREEFTKWARSVFKKRGIPRKDYEYWLSDVNGSPDAKWDGSYKGLSQDKLIGDDLGAWFPKYRDEHYEGDDDDRTLRPYDQMNEMGAEPMMLQVGDQITPDMLKNPSQFDFPMEIVSFSNDGNEDTVRVKRRIKSKGMFGGRGSEDTFEDLVSNWERIHLKPNVRMSAQTEMDFDNSMNEGPFTLETLADYKIAFDIAAEIGVTAAAVGFAIYKFGIKKTVAFLKKGAKEFNEMIKWATNKNK
jgi:hypothetical protein